MTKKTTPKRQPILLVFSDDSTLIFTRRMRDLLQKADPKTEIKTAWYAGENALSYRQMEQYLPEGPDMGLRKQDFRLLMESDQFSALIASRMFAPLSGLMEDHLVKATGPRPCVIGFLGGLDFFPQNGYYRRRNCDAAYVFPEADVEVFQNQASKLNGFWMETGFGHPSFLRPEPKTAPDLSKRKDIYFFTQALSPSTERGRIHMVRAMAAMARANPDRTVWIKLRHLPNENREHLHLEKHDYPGLMAAMTDLPENLKMTACTMDEAMEDAALGITCTSTAAIDLVREGIPCMVHLDFVDNYVDDLVPPMRKLFAKSGLITSLDDMLNLRSNTPDPEWVDAMLCPRDLGTRVLDTIDRFQARAFQVSANPLLDELRDKALRGPTNGKT